MRVMVVSPGHSIHTKRFIESLLSDGNKVVAVCEKNPLPEGCNGFRFVFCLPYFYPGSRKIHFLLDKFIGFKAVEQFLVNVAGLYLRLLWLWFQPGVVHLLWLDGRANVCLAGGLKPLVLNCWGSDINQHFTPDADPYKRELCRQALSGADMVICDTPDVIEKCGKISGKPIKTALLHLGVDTEKFSPKPPNIRKMWRERLDIPPDAKVLISMRAWDRLYGHHLVLEAFSAACKRAKDIFLIFKLYNLDPESCDYKDVLCYRAEELGITERIRWLNAVPYEELPEIYALSDIVVNYPEMDSLGVTLMEAASCKKHVITCDLPCYRGTFVEKYAKMVPYADLGKLEDAIVELAARPSLNDDPLLVEARRAVEENYSYTGFSEKLKAINQALAQ